MDENTKATELLPWAMHIARCMTKDPEGQSIAGMATLCAIRSFRSELEVPIERWVALNVRHQIWCHWRKLRARPFARTHDTDGLDASCEDEPWEEETLSVEDRILLFEHYVDRWPLDVIARRHCTTIHRIRRQIAAATARYKRSVV